LLVNNSEFQKPEEAVANKTKRRATELRFEQRAGKRHRPTTCTNMVREIGVSEREVFWTQTEFIG
jgi:hypothetical protein